MKTIGVIPARYGSTRLPGKPLADICGKPMIQHVYERVKRASLLDDVIVATDDERIVRTVVNFGGKAVLTSTTHLSGTSRTAEVVKKMEVDVVVNIQGDEPLVDPRMIDEVVEVMIQDENIPMATLYYEIFESSKFDNPNVVKVVFDRNNFALYFSRSLIPFPRNRESFRCYEHIGIYVYRKPFLMKYIEAEDTPLHLTESLEQLKALELGYKIKVVETKYQYEGLSADTKEDLEKIREILKSRS